MTTQSVSMDIIKQYWEAMEHLVSQDKVHSLGICDLNKESLEELYKWAKVRQMLFKKSLVPSAKASNITCYVVKGVKIFPFIRMMGHETIKLIKRCSISKNHEIAKEREKYLWLNWSVSELSLAWRSEDFQFIENFSSELILKMGTYVAASSSLKIMPT